MVHQELLDIIAHMIDPPLRACEEGTHQASPSLQRSLAQLPWTLEYACINFLYKKIPHLFRAAPQHERGLIFRDAIFHPGYPDDLQDAGNYHSGQPYFLNYCLVERFARARHGSRKNASFTAQFPEVETWFSKNGLHESTHENPDPHFAKRAFVINVLVPAYGAEVLSWITPREKIENTSHFVDFVIETPHGRIALEVDDREYHDAGVAGQNKFEYELNRQNEIVAQGLRLFRYTARRILQEPSSVMRDVLHHLPVIGSPSQRISGKTASAYEAPDNPAGPDEIGFIEEYGAWFRPFQLGLLLALARSQTTTPFRVFVRHAPRGLVELVLIDLGILIRQACQLFGATLELPNAIELHFAEAQGPPEEHRALREDFLEALSQGPDGFELLESSLPFTLSVCEASELGSAADLLIDLSRQGRIPLWPHGESKSAVLGCESATIAVMRERLHALSVPRPGAHNSLRPLHLHKRLLDYFARRFLRIPSLHHHFDKDNRNQELRQYELVRRVLQGESVLGVMPNGRAQSVGFQLPALLKPGGAMVVSPRRALIKDQVTDLRERRGRNDVAAIPYDLRPDEKEQALGDFIHGYTKLLYVSPESLMIQGFDVKLAQAAAALPMSFLAVEEAHCVSEWGDDFRESYHGIPDFVGHLTEQMPGRPCPIVALTATASPPVLSNICSILSLQKADARAGGQVIKEEISDRTELSFSVHKIASSDYPSDRQEVLKRILLEVLPIALAKNHKLRWEDFVNDSWRDKGAGIIFCVYASPKGHTSWQNGAGAVQHLLLTHGLISEENVQIYTSSPPEFCPECERAGKKNYALRRMTALEQSLDPEFARYICANHHVFAQPQSEKAWEHHQHRTKSAFEKNGFPLLIATKAYGKGIDPPNLRFVVHYGISTSIEAYYQEASRAGRDGKQAHCALITRMPEARCLQQLRQRKGEARVAATALPPCMKKAWFKKHECPDDIGLPEPCDYARQLRMVLERYRQPKFFAAQCTTLWSKLVTNASDRAYVAEKICGEGRAGGRQLQNMQNYLSRFKQLGLIKPFKLEYLRHQDHFDVRFHIPLNPQASGRSVINNLKANLDELYQHNEEPLQKVLYEVDFHDAAAMDAPPSVELVNKSIQALFAGVRNQVLNMRMEAYGKLIRYAEGTGQCRRVELLPGRAGERQDDQQCQFCDTCVPDLNFDREAAEPAPESGQFNDIRAALVEAFDTENFNRYAWAYAEAQKKKFIAALGQQATARLASEPDNLLANLAAMESYRDHPDPELQQWKHRYGKRYARITNIEKRDEKLALRGYHSYLDSGESAPKDPEAIRAYAYEKSVFDNLRRLAEIDHDAEATELGDAEKLCLKANHCVERYKVAVKQLIEDQAVQDALAEWRG